MNKKQAYWVPRFTEQGFEKVPIPEAVYNVLKAEHRMLEDRKQEESCQSVINCLEIQEDEEAEECSLKTTQKTYMMKPRFSFLFISRKVYNKCELFVSVLSLKE